MAHDLSRLTFEMETSTEQHAVEAMLSCFAHNLHKYEVRVINEEPTIKGSRHPTVTIYVDAYPINLTRFIADVAAFQLCDVYARWDT